MPNKATREQSKLFNQRLVLKLVYDQPQISRAEIARLTGLSKTTVSGAIGELIGAGLVTEAGRATTNGGKPATMLNIVDGSRNLIGLDIAESEFSGAVTDLRGQILYRIAVPVNGADRAASLETIFALVDALRAQAQAPILGIGVGVPGTVDIARGTVRGSVHFDWSNLPLRQLLQERYHVPVHIANDSHTAAFGEYVFGGQPVTNLIVVRVALGVSAGVVLNGQIHYGDGGYAGEIGHIVVVPDGKPCECGNRGCLETIVSRRALLERARELASANPASKLHQFASGIDDIRTVDVVLRAYRAGDPELRRVVDEMGAALGIAVAWLVGALNIERILMAGSLMRFGQPLLDAVCRSFVKSNQITLTQMTQIQESSLGPDIVIQGGAALVLSHELGVV